MKVQVTVLTHRGLKRSSNEDCVAAAGWLRSSSSEAPSTFVYDLTTSTLFAVADGLGGHASGELASLIALSRLQEGVVANGLTPEDLKGRVSEIHAELLELSRSSPSLRGFGTTLAGLILDPKQTIKVFNVGDSRVYRRQDNYLEQLSKDDRLPSTGYGEAQASASNTLLQCVGGQSGIVETHVFEVAACASSETFLICTDGLHDIVSIDDMEKCMSPDSQAWAKQLFEKACGAGAADNISIMIVSTALAEKTSE